MRKLSIWLLCLALLATGPAGAANLQEWIVYTTPAQDSHPLQAGTELAVGTITVMSGFFATDLWGANSADRDVRALLHGHQTIVWKGERPMFNGTAVQSVDVQATERGALFAMEIAEGLVYNDGTPLTAEDYVFSLLLEASPAVKALDGQARNLDYILGFDAYQAGETQLFSGVRLLSPTRFALELHQAALDDFFGPALLSVTPYPAAVIAPGLEVADDGEGAYLAKDGAASGLSADLLLRTLLDPVGGYARNPRMTSGPYALEDFDLNEGWAAFRVNPLFQGDAWGMKPSIEKLRYLRVDEDAAAEKLRSGEIGLMNKAFNPGVVKQFEALEGFEKAVYPRTGLAYLAFAMEGGPGGHPAVRRAIAMALDREAFTSAQHGLELVNGYYGLGQWMVGEVPSDALRALGVGFDVEAANRLLNAAGWNMAEDGGAFVPGNGKTRHRLADGALEPLEIVLARSIQSALADDVEAMLRNGLQSAGIGLHVLNLPFDELLAQTYHQQERTADLYFMATDFAAEFHPGDSFTFGAEEHTGYRNVTSVQDEALLTSAQALTNVGFDNRSGYAEAWLGFQARFMEVLPMIPLYSGNYADYFVANLKGYDVLQSGGWAEAIVAARLE